MGRQFLKEMRVVGCESRLEHVHDETIWKISALHPVKAAHAFFPFLHQGSAAAPMNLVTCSPRVGGSDFEAGREDDAVHLVFDTLYDKALLGDLVNALSIGIDEFNIGAIERRKKVVVEGWALTEHLVVGLQFFGDFRIFDQLVHARADLGHFFEVGHFENFRDVRAAILHGIAKAAEPSFR